MNGAEGGMRSEGETHLRPWMRRAASLVALVLLLAQTAGAAHYHPLPSTHEYATNGTAVAHNGLCAVCLVRFHSPVAFVIALHPGAMAPERWQLPLGARAESHSACRSLLFGRAPPASL